MHFKISSAICFNLDRSKILSSCNGLKQFSMFEMHLFFSSTNAPKMDQHSFFFSKQAFVCSTSLLKTLWEKEQEGHDGPVSLNWLIREIHSYQTLHYLGIGLKHKTPYKDYIRQP